MLLTPPPSPPMIWATAAAAAAAAPRRRSSPAAAEAAEGPSPPPPSPPTRSSAASAAAAAAVAAVPEPPPKIGGGGARRTPPPPLPPRPALFPCMLALLVLVVVSFRLEAGSGVNAMRGALVRHGRALLYVRHPHHRLATGLPAKVFSLEQFIRLGRSPSPLATSQQEQAMLPLPDFYRPSFYRLVLPIGHAWDRLRRRAMEAQPPTVSTGPDAPLANANSFEQQPPPAADANGYDEQEEEGGILRSQRRAASDATTTAEHQLEADDMLRFGRRKRRPTF